MFRYKNAETERSNLLVVTLNRVVAIVLQFIEFMTWHQFNAVDTNVLQKKGQENVAVQQHLAENTNIVYH